MTKAINEMLARNICIQNAKLPAVYLFSRFTCASIISFGRRATKNQSENPLKNHLFHTNRGSVDCANWSFLFCFCFSLAFAFRQVPPVGLPSVNQSTAAKQQKIGWSEQAKRRNGEMTTIGGRYVKQTPLIVSWSSSPACERDYNVTNALMALCVAIG